MPPGPGYKPSQAAGTQAKFTHAKSAFQADRISTVDNSSSCNSSRADGLMGYQIISCSSFVRGIRYRIESIKP